MKINEGALDRKIRIVLGIVALIVGMFILTGTLKVIALILATVLLFTGIIGFCALYALFGVNTLKK